MKQPSSVWKKTLAGVLAFSMVAGSAAGVAFAHDDRKGGNGKGNKGHGKGRAEVTINLNFYDLDEKDWAWAYPHIIRLASQGVFKGYDDGSFKPRNNITRVETIIAAVRLLGLEAEAQKPENMNAKLNFQDFDLLKKKYPNAVGYVAVALQNDLFSETETRIQPDKPASRLWASVLLVKGLKLESEALARMNTDLTFKDDEQIPAGSVGYIAVAVEKGIIAGYPNGKFQPNKPVTRAELATILSRLDGQLPDHGNTDGQAVTGTVTAVVYSNAAGGSVTLKKADNTSVTIPLAADVFVFRDNVKVPASAIQAGDQVLIRTYQGQAVFIEVTQKAVAVVPFTDAGKISAYTLNAQGKIATLSLNKDVNGTASTVVYNVDPNVTIKGGSGILATNLLVFVKGENNVVKEIEIVG